MIRGTAGRSLGLVLYRAADRYPGLPQRADLGQNGHAVFAGAAWALLVHLHPHQTAMWSRISESVADVGSTVTTGGIWRRCRCNGGNDNRLAAYTAPLGSLAIEGHDAEQ